MYKMPDFVDDVGRYGRIIPVMLHYKFEDVKNPKPIAEIPIFETVEGPIVLLQSKISEANFQWARRYEIRPSDIKTVIEQSVMDTRNPESDSPQLFSGPSSDAPAAYIILSFRNMFKITVSENCYWHLYGFIFILF